MQEFCFEFSGLRFAIEVEYRVAKVTNHLNFIGSLVNR